MLANTVPVADQARAAGVTVMFACMSFRKGIGSAPGNLTAS